MVIQVSLLLLIRADNLDNPNILLGYLAWRRLGDLVATIYAAGIHLDPGDSEYYPFFLQQWRRGCFISAFYMDKMMASFVGRPPLMNYRYCTLDLPLDLSDEDLMEGGEALSQAIAALGPFGWDPHGIQNRMSSLRLRFQLGISREKTLDIALAPSPDTQNMLQTARYVLTTVVYSGINSDIANWKSEIQKELQTVWEAAPAYLRYDLHTDPEKQHGWISSIYPYLSYLYTSFLLQRALIKHINTGQEALFDISRRILSIVTSMTTQRNTMVDLDIHYSWIVRILVSIFKCNACLTNGMQALTYGLPSASILLIELLHQSHAPTTHAVPLPRAEIIRNLSVFVSLLSWISRPGQGNYRECKEAEKKLSRILDRLLDPQPVQADTVHDVTSNLSTFLNWSNFNSWDFNPEFFPGAEGYPGLL